MKIGVIEITAALLNEVTLPDVPDELVGVMEDYFKTAGMFVKHDIQVGVLVGIHLGLKLAERQLCPTTPPEAQ